MAKRVVDKLQPHNVEAEEAVIGSLLIDPDAIIRVEKILSPADFFIVKNEWVYQAMLDLHHKHVPPRLLMLTDELERREQIEEVGGVARLIELSGNTFTSTDVEHYAHIVERSAVLRRLIRAGDEIVQLAYNSGEEAEAVIDQAQSIIVPVFSLVGKHQKGTVHISQPLGVVMDHIDDQVNGDTGMLGLTTGLDDLDKILGGLHPTNMIILAGRPGTGKTSLANSIAMINAQQGKRVGFCSLEMSDEEQVIRVLSNESKIDSQRLKQGKLAESEWSTYLEAASRINELPIYINDRSGLTIFDLRNIALSMYAEHGLDLLIIDYLQLMRGTGDKKQNREQEISDISRGIKALAKELRIPILALSQLNRDCESRSDKRPRLSDLRESGSLEQDCDVALFIYRDELYNPDTEFPNIAEIIVGKHRNGPTGVFSVYFKKYITQFVDLEVRHQPLEY